MSTEAQENGARICLKDSVGSCSSSTVLCRRRIDTLTVRQWDCRQHIWRIAGAAAERPLRWWQLWGDSAAGSPSPGPRVLSVAAGIALRSPACVNLQLNGLAHSSSATAAACPPRSLCLRQRDMEVSTQLPLLQAYTDIEVCWEGLIACCLHGYHGFRLTTSWTWEFPICALTSHKHVIPA